MENFTNPGFYRAIFYGTSWLFLTLGVTVALSPYGFEEDRKFWFLIMLSVAILLASIFDSKLFYKPASTLSDLLATIFAGSFLAILLLFMAPERAHLGAKIYTIVYAYTYVVTLAALAWRIMHSGKKPMEPGLKRIKYFIGCWLAIPAALVLVGSLIALVIYLTMR